MGKYSGISYVIDDNGTSSQFANKISTINGCDYNLLDAHRVDWNRSNLLYANKDNMIQKYVEEFFGSYIDETGTKRYSRYLGSDFETKYPDWFNTGQFNHTSELLDMNDYLCWVTTYAMKCIESIYRSLENDKTILKLNPTQIENLGGTIDQTTSDVRNNPIRFELKPNQNQSNFVGVGKCFPVLEQRSLNFDLRVYSVDGSPLSDPNIFWSNPNDAEKISLLEVNTDVIIGPLTPILRMDETVKLSENVTNPNIAGYFNINLILKGWDADSRFRCNSIILYNTNYKEDNYKRVEFIASLGASANYQRSGNRQVNILVSKAQNDFEYVYINDDMYIFIPEYFFIHKNEANNDVLLATDEYKEYLKYHKTENDDLKSYLVKASDVPSLDMINKLTREYIFENNLQDELIPVGNYNDITISGESKFRSTLNIAANAKMNIEVYPKYFGDENYINDYKLPTGYDVNDEASKFNPNTYKTFKEQYEYNISSSPKTDGFYMIPLCSLVPSNDTAGNVIKNSIEYEDCVSFGGANNFICSECEKTINGLKRKGFKFSFKINCTDTLLKDIRNNNTSTKQYGFVDLYFGTTASNYVGANVFKIRMELQQLNIVYLIDYNKEYNEQFPSLSKLRNQAILNLGSSNLTNEVTNALKVKGSYELIKYQLTPVIEKLDGPITEYLIDLDIPIFSAWSWNTNPPLKKYESIIDTEVITPTTLVDVNTVGYKNKLEDPNNRNIIPNVFENNDITIKPIKLKYENGFPELCIGVTGNEENAKNQNVLFSAKYFNTKDNLYTDISKEIKIDYAATYNINKDGFIKALSESTLPQFKQIVNSINLATTDTLKGQELCKYFVGIISKEYSSNKNEIGKYLSFIRPTIPSEKYFGKSEFNTEWENIDSGNTNKFKLILTIPEQTAGNNTHFASKITINLNVYRANKEYSGWARRAKTSNRYVADEVSISFGKEIKYDNLIGTTEFNFSNSLKVLTRNMQNIKLHLSDIILKQYKDKDNNIQYIEIGKYNISFNDGTSTTIYERESTDKKGFIFYSTEEEAMGENHALTLNDVNYSVDIPLNFKLQFNNDGNEWFRGYYDNDTRDINVVIHRNDIPNKLTFKGELTASSFTLQSNDDETNKIQLPQFLIQHIAGDTIGDKSYESGQYAEMLMTGGDATISVENLKKFKLRIFDFFVENGIEDELRKIYGDNYISEFLRVSITAGIQSGGSYPPTYINCINNNILNKDSMKMFLRDKNVDYSDECIYNKYYYNREIVDIREYITYNNNGIISFEKIEGIYRVDGIIPGNRLGLYIAVMLPMTNKYRGQLFIIKLDLTII